MIELKKKIVDVYLEYRKNCGCEHCNNCLYFDVSLPNCEAILLADYLVASDIFKTPAVPGPSENDHNVMELCFRNGEQHMKGKMIAKAAEVFMSQDAAKAMAIVRILEEVK